MYLQMLVKISTTRSATETSSIHHVLSKTEVGKLVNQLFLSNLCLARESENK